MKVTTPEKIDLKDLLLSGSNVSGPLYDSPSKAKCQKFGKIAINLFYEDCRGRFMYQNEG